ncbi:MAG: transglutaminase domain-containing protein [Lachnospiraceae bacterium]|nr:transglutaminase domain-containing protein [Candidatus Merdinaster equi]
MKTLQNITAGMLLAIAVIFCMPFLGLETQAAGKTQVISTNQECSIWSAPNTSEQNRVKKVPAGYQITVYTDVVQSTKGDGKTFYKTLKNCYILCKYCTGGSANPSSQGDVIKTYSTGNIVLDAKIESLIKGLMTKGMTRDQLLKAAYNHLVVKGKYDAFAQYDYSSLYAGGDLHNELARAYGFLCTYKGDCYDFSDAFIAIAGYLGYNAYGVRGVCASSSSSTGWTNHGWACIYQDGYEYVYDPQIDNRVYSRNGGKNTYCRYGKKYSSLKGLYMQYDANAMLQLFGDPIYSPWLLFTPYQAPACDASYDNRKVIYI